MFFYLFFTMFCSLFKIKIQVFLLGAVEEKKINDTVSKVLNKDIVV